MGAVVRMLGRAGRSTGTAYRRLGFRGRSLLAFALVDVVQGWALADPQQRRLAGPAYALLARWVPLHVWGVLWLSVAVACAVQAWTRDDRIAFGCAISVKVVWATGLYGAWLFGNAPRAWVGATVWLCLSLLVANIAGWTEPVDAVFWPKVPKPPQSQEKS